MEICFIEDSALGKLDKTRKAGAAVAELLRLKPDFSTNGPWLIGCYTKFEHLVEDMLDGLRKAGLRT